MSDENVAIVRQGFERFAETGEIGWGTMDPHAEALDAAGLPA